MDQGGQMLPFRGRQILLLLEPPLQLVDLKCKNSVSTDGYRILPLDFNVTVNDMSNGKKSRTPISARRAGSVGSWRVRSNFGLPSGPRRDRARADGGRGLPVPGWRAPASSGVAPVGTASAWSRARRTRPGPASPCSGRDPCWRTPPSSPSTWKLIRRVFMSPSYWPHRAASANDYHLHKYREKI